MPHLLLEIGTEEIPASYIAPALRSLEEAVRKGLEEKHLTVGRARTAATPRRLALFAEGIPEASPEEKVEVRGPAKKAAYDASGKPTSVLESFARAQGVGVEGIAVRETPKGPYCFAAKVVPPVRAAEVLSLLLPQVLRLLPFPKTMIWEKSRFRFARPLRSLVALFGTEVVPFEIGGVRSGRAAAGHPFLAAGKVDIPDASFENYVEALRAAKVVVEREDRRAAIEKGLRSRMAAGTRLPEHLLDEVTDLVEYPHVFEGRFPSEALDLPPEVIEAAMMEHQRYFPVRGADGRLEPRFLFVANRGPENEALVREGNERVLRARLSDARFFWESDRKVPLADRIPKLKEIVFHEALGTYHEKAERMKLFGGLLVIQIAKQVWGEDTLENPLAKKLKKLERAALLAKADLLTEMVFEFPSLQGIMGREYARASGEDSEVADSLAEQYLPRRPDDPIPKTGVGALLSMADKLDTLVGIFSIGKAPTGSSDPYGLRRQANGILRILIEKGWHFSLERAVVDVADRFPEALYQPRPAEKGKPQKARTRDTVGRDLRAFFDERLVQTALDGGFPYDLVAAAAKTGTDDPFDFDLRLRALSELSKKPFWPKLVVAVERTGNITRVLPEADPDRKISEGLLASPEEKDLWKRYLDHRDAILRAIEERRYVEAAERYVEVFGDALHAFFERIFVNVEDPALRENRLRLLRSIHLLFASRIADLSEIVTK